MLENEREYREKKEKKEYSEELDVKNEKNEKDRRRAARRHHEKRVQSKRLHDFKDWAKDIAGNPRRLGGLKKNHLGCGCPMCKPWKHGLESKYRISDLRRLDDAMECCCG